MPSWRLFQPEADQGGPQPAHQLQAVDKPAEEEAGGTEGHGAAQYDEGDHVGGEGGGHPGESQADRAEQQHSLPAKPVREETPDQGAQGHYDHVDSRGHRPQSPTSTSTSEIHLLEGANGLYVR